MRRCLLMYLSIHECKKTHFKKILMTLKAINKPSNITRQTLFVTLGAFIQLFCAPSHSPKMNCSYETFCNNVNCKGNLKMRKNFFILHIALWTFFSECNIFISFTIYSTLNFRDKSQELLIPFLYSKRKFISFNGTAWKESFPLESRCSSWKSSFK